MAEYEENNNESEQPQDYAEIKRQIREKQRIFIEEMKQPHKDSYDLWTKICRLHAWNQSNSNQFTYSMQKMMASGYYPEIETLVTWYDKELEIFDSMLVVDKLVSKDFDRINEQLTKGLLESRKNGKQIV